MSDQPASSTSVAWRWGAVTIDCQDPHRLAQFWTALLGVEIRGSVGQYVGLEAMAPGHPRLILQGTDRARPARNSLHLDLHVPADQLDSAVARAVELGAQRVEEVTELGLRWEVLADPEGNLFCIVGDPPGP